MHCKDIRMVIDIREGQSMPDIASMNAVLVAADWKVRLALKVYGGEALKLAEKAAKKGADLVLSYGGDGTLNQVLNGVMSAGGKSIVGVIPGGTANEWAGEISIPNDHVKAALTLVNSDAREVDLGYVSVQGLTLPGDTAQSSLPQEREKKGGKKKKLSGTTKQYFLLMAGLGIDAAVIAYASKSLKYHLGRFAFDAAAVKELPRQKPFPIEIWASGNGSEPDAHWQGEAIQVIFANTRRYANLIEVTPNAYLDDGLLDLCVITDPTNPLATIGQIGSLLLRHKPDSRTSKFFRGAHLKLRVPASILMHLDGSSVELKDYLSESEQQALKQAPDLHQVMVTYQFDAVPHALQIAIPRTYDNTLFLHSQAYATTQQRADKGGKRSSGTREVSLQQQAGENAQEWVAHGEKVTVIGVVAHPEKPETYIVAGSMLKQVTGDTEQIAVRIDSATALLKRNDGHIEHVSVESVKELKEGSEIVVKGEKNKHSVLRATSVII